MKTTVYYLDAVKAKKQFPSDYALAKFLGITQSSVIAFRNGRSAMGIETCIKVGEVLGIDSHIIYADGQLERAKTPEAKSFWLATSEKFSLGFKLLLSGAGPRRA